MCMKIMNFHELPSDFESILEQKNELTLWHNVQQSRPTVFQLGLHRINIGWVNWWGLLASTILQVWHLHHPQLFLVCKKGKLHVKFSPSVVESFQDFLIELDMKLRMHLMEISIFSINYVIVRLTKIMNNLLKLDFLKLRHIFVGTFYFQKSDNDKI